MRVLVFGDNIGIPQVLQHLAKDNICGIVAAEIRSQYLEPLEHMSKAQGIQFNIQPKYQSGRYPAFLEWVNMLQPDIFLVNSYSMKLHSDLLSLSSEKGINVHGGLLPKYQGANPIQWSIINEESEAGVTMHFMTEQIDGGDIIAQETVEIAHEDTWVEVFQNIQSATNHLLKTQIPQMIKGQLNCYPQDHSKAHYWPRRKPEDGKIDWNQPIEKIYNLIRALVHPLPGAFYEVDGKKVVIDRFLSINEVSNLKSKYQTQ